MIENLNGVHEMVTYNNNLNFRIFYNVDDEIYPLHWHTPIEIIMPLVDGYQVICAEKKYSLKEGDIAFICPGVLHSVGTGKKGERLIIQIDYSVVQQIKETESIITLISPGTLITPENSPNIYARLKEIILSMKKEYDSKEAFIDIALYGKLMEMMVLLGRNLTQTAVVTNSDNSFIKNKVMMDKIMNICDYINEHCTEDLCLDDIAAMAGFSKYHLARQFKMFTNISFYKYLTQKRISTAEKMLLDFDMPVTNVAMQSGFSSMSTFIRMFKIVKGCTPSEYRKMYMYNQNK